MINKHTYHFFFINVHHSFPGRTLGNGIGELTIKDERGNDVSVDHAVVCHHYNTVFFKSRTVESEKINQTATNAVNDIQAATLDEEFAVR